MIKITVTGDTFPIRTMLKGSLFQYNHNDLSWYRGVKESELNALLDTLMPEYHYGYDNREINIKLESTDKNVRGVVRFTLTPGGAKAGVDYLEIFKRKMSGFQLITNKETHASSCSGELPKLDGGFF